MPTIQTNDIVQSYDFAGEGPALVFIHGAFTDRKLWRRQISHFSPRFRCLSYDLRGHGATGPSARRRYDIGLFADDLESLMDALSIDRAHVVGSSLGGMIAQRFAERRPDRVDGLFLLSSFADTTGPQPDLPPLHLAPNWMATLALKAWGMRRFVAYAKSRAAKMQGHPVGFSGEDPPMMFMKPSEVPKIYKAIFTFRAASPDMRIPANVACGALEHPVVKTHAKALAALRKTPLIEIDGAGHIASVEQPERLNALLERFLAAADRAVA